MDMQTDYPEIVQVMLDPAFYPHRSGEIKLIQTQMSFVFLCGDYAYKIKKPVNLGYLDYTSLEKRHFFCQNELNLNRRLCSEAYLEVLPISRKAGKIFLGQDGEVLEYTLKMRRLPQEKMLNMLLESGGVTDDMITRVASKISEFHKNTATGPHINEYGNLKAIAFNTEENFNQTEKSVGRTISEAKYLKIRDYTRKYLSHNEKLFNERVNLGKIRDCHGDLHAAHICFTGSICIYDCIEFNDRFRYSDVASEVAFLSMDLDRYGRADLSSTFTNRYIEYSSDTDLLKLLPFYKCYRAYVRGKVESFKLDDLYISPQDKALAALNAHGYFDLAGFYIRPRPALLITVGVTGTGKTTLADRLARHTGAVVISSDIIRKQSSGIPLTEHHFDDFDTGLYSSQNTQNTYAAMLQKAALFLSQGKTVILDATFTKQVFRSQSKDLAEKYDADFLLVECLANKDDIIERLARRAKTNAVSDGRQEILEQQLTRFEPIGEENDVHIVIDTSRPLEDNINQIMAKLGEY